MPFSVYEEMGAKEEHEGQAYSLSETMGRAADEINPIRPLTLGLTATAILEVSVSTVNPEGSSATILALLSLLPTVAGVVIFLHSLGEKLGFSRSSRSLRDIAIEDRNQIQRLSPLKHQGGRNDPSRLN